MSKCLDDSTMHTSAGTQGARAATAATDDSTLTVQTQHLAGPATGAVVRSFLNPEGGKGCFKHCGALQLLGTIDDPIDISDDAIREVHFSPGTIAVIDDCFADMTTTTSIKEAQATSQTSPAQATSQTSPIPGNALPKPPATAASDRTHLGTDASSDTANADDTRTPQPSPDADTSMGAALEVVLNLPRAARNKGAMDVVDQDDTSALCWDLHKVLDAMKPGSESGLDSGGALEVVHTSPRAARNGQAPVMVATADADNMGDMDGLDKCEENKGQDTKLDVQVLATMRKGVDDDESTPWTEKSDQLKAPNQMLLPEVQQV